MFQVLKNCYSEINFPGVPDCGSLIHECEMKGTSVTNVKIFHFFFFFDFFVLETQKN